MEESQELEYRDISNHPGADKLSCGDECVAASE